QPHASHGANQRQQRTRAERVVQQGEAKVTKVGASIPGRPIRRIQLRSVKSYVQILSAGVLAIAASFAFSTQATQQSDPLPSWNDGDAKRAIIDFVRVTTTEQVRNSSSSA